MQTSRYNISLPDEPNPGEMLIFNTLSGSLFVLEPEYRQSLEALQNGAELGDDDLVRLGEMQAEGYVVGDGVDEDDMVIQHMRTMVYTKPHTFMAKVMTTMACNLACEYCFESHADRSQAMSLETARRVLQKIQLRAEDIEAQGVELDFYGGEPLINPEVIRFLSRELLDWCRETGRTYSFTMTTNGTLLTPELVTELKPLGFKGARVSLDGVKEVHDSRRPFRAGGGSSYEAIMRNLHQVAELVPITIVTVYSEDNPDQYLAFMDELAAQGILDKLAGVQPGLEMDYLDEKGRACNSGACEMDARQAKRFVGLLKILAGRGVRVRQDLLAGVGCSMATNSGVWIFTPGGLIHKCPMVAHQDVRAVGSVDSPAMFPSFHADLNREFWRKCLHEEQCPYLPMCGPGLGCRAEALGRTGDLWGMACNRSFFEYYVPQAMRLELASMEEGEA